MSIEAGVPGSRERGRNRIGAGKCEVAGEQVRDGVEEAEIYWVIQLFGRFHLESTIKIWCANVYNSQSFFSIPLGEKKRCHLGFMNALIYDYFLDNIFLSLPTAERAVEFI